jgi:hypothetical protein
MVKGEQGKMHIAGRNQGHPKNTDNLAKIWKPCIGKNCTGRNQGHFTRIWKP